MAKLTIPLEASNVASAKYLSEQFDDASLVRLSTLLRSQDFTEEFLSYVSSARERLEKLKPLAKAKAEIEQAAAELASKQKTLSDLRGSREILCACKSMHRICDLDLIVTHWYVPPRGCTEGDYYNEGEKQFVCPVNGVRNRLLFDSPDYKNRDNPVYCADTAFNNMYRWLFKSRTDDYEKNAPSANNYYVDQHRAEFELPLKPEKSK